LDEKLKKLKKVKNELEFTKKDLSDIEYENQRYKETIEKYKNKYSNYKSKCKEMEIDL